MSIITKKHTFESIDTLDQDNAQLFLFFIEKKHIF
jgi:hypothetical protein